MRKSIFTLRRLVLNSLMISLYLGLATLLTIPLGGLKITIEALPVVICAVIFGPWDAAIVGFLGEFLNQMLSFGFTPTTLLWVAPSVVRGLMVGLALLPMKKSGSLLSQKLSPNRLAVFYIINLASAVVVSLMNTFTLYVDSKMFGYYSYAMVFGSLALRILTGLVATAAMATLTLPIVAALKRARLVK